jgi:hypothetical protein
MKWMLTNSIFVILVDATYSLMTNQSSPVQESRIRQIVPCALALAIFIIPTIITLVVFPIAGPIMAFWAGMIAFLIILGIYILIWWFGRPPK